MHSSVMHSCWNSHFLASSQQCSSSKLCQLQSRIRPRQRRGMRACNASPTTQTTDKDKIEAPSNCVIANFSVQGKVAFGEWLRLVGSSEEFGRWGPLEGPLLRWNEGNVWKASIRLPCTLEKLEFKVVVCHEQGGDPKWEQVPNRVLEIPSEPGILDHSCKWGAMDGSTTSFRPTSQETTTRDQKESQGSTPNIMAALPGRGKVGDAPAEGSSSHASHNQQPRDSKPALDWPSNNGATPSQPQTNNGKPPTPKSSSTKEDKEEYSMFGLVGTAAMAATATAALLLALALGQAAMLMNRPAEGSASSKPSKEEVFPKGTAVLRSSSSPISATGAVPAPALSE